MAKTRAKNPFTPHFTVGTMVVIPHQKVAAGLSRQGNDLPRTTLGHNFAPRK
jgi:hypothetical protein